MRKWVGLTQLRSDERTGFILQQIKTVTQQCPPGYLCPASVEIWARRRQSQAWKQPAQNRAQESLRWETMARAFPPRGKEVNGLDIRVDCCCLGMLLLLLWLFFEILLLLLRLLFWDVVVVVVVVLVCCGCCFWLFWIVVCYLGLLCVIVGRCGLLLLFWVILCCCCCCCCRFRLLLSF